MCQPVPAGVLTGQLRTVNTPVATFTFECGAKS